MRTIRHSNPFLEILEQRRLLSLSSGVTSPPEDFNAHVVWAPPPPLVADFTSDGILDKLSSNSHEVLIRPGRGDGTFGDPIRTSIWPTPGAPLLAVADFNGDSRLDVFTGAAIDFESPPTVNVLLGYGDGRFILAETFSVGTVPTMIGTGEIFGTGRTDVAIAGYDYLSGEHGVLELFNDGQWWTPAPISRTYVGPTGGNWSSAGNWSPSGVPTASDLVTITGKSVNLSAGATLASLTLTGGATLNVAAGHRVLWTGTLNISSNSKLNLNDNDLVVENGIFSQIQNLVVTGYSATPDGTKAGIISTTGQNSGKMILALFDNGALGGSVSEWPPGSGQTVGAHAIIGKYTYFGDANFDGRVTGDDYLVLDANLNTAPPAGVGWIFGDMNFDGTVRGDDYLVCDANLGVVL